MAYFAAGASAASLIGGIVSSKSSKKLMKEQLAIQRETLDFNKKRYTDNKALYGELEKTVVAAAQKGVVADLGGVTSRAAADVATQFTNAEGAQARQMQRLGVNPNSGRAESMARQTALSRAMAEASATTTAREAERRNAEDKTFNRQFSVNQLGINQLNSTAGDVNNSNTAIANTYGNAAAQKAAQANSFYSTAGQIAGIGLGQMGGATTPTTPAAPPPLLAARSPSTPAYVSPKDTAFNNLYSAIKY